MAPTRLDLKENASPFAQNLNYVYAEQETNNNNNRMERTERAQDAHQMPIAMVIKDMRKETQKPFTF